MNINFDSETPIYVQVATELEDAILSGAFPEETQVPSTTEISVTYRINPATVLKGMTILTDEGILYKKRGVGMFVSTGAVQTVLHKRRESFFHDYLARMLEEAHKLGFSTEEVIRMIEEEKR